MMYKLILSIAIATNIGCSTLNNSNNGYGQIKNCTFAPMDVYITNWDRKIVNITNAPNGQVILNLNEINDDLTLSIIDTNDDWFRVSTITGIEGNNIEIPGNIGWIQNTAIGMSTRRYIDLLDMPEKGNVVGSIKQENGITVVAICSTWVKVAYEGTMGWVDRQWLCGNPVTTCP